MYDATMDNFMRVEWRLPAFALSKGSIIKWEIKGRSVHFNTLIADYRLDAVRTVHRTADDSPRCYFSKQTATPSLCFRKNLDSKRRNALLPIQMMLRDERFS